MSQSSGLVTLQLVQLVLNTPSGSVIEIGCHVGGTTIELAKVAKTVGKQVIAVDPYERTHEFFPDRGYTVGVEKLLIWKSQFRENVVDKFDNVIWYHNDITECIDKIPDLSVIFIDGRHEYECVYREFTLLLPKLVSGGAMVIHDINWPGLEYTKDLICPSVFRDISIIPDKYNAKVGIKL